MNSKAIIYCRVSSERQVNEGSGLRSQEKRCRDYANEKNYLIIKVFPDEGVSGGLFERPAMKNLISFLDNHPGEKYVIIFDDLSRFARDVKVHIQLKTELISRGAKLECLNFNFDESEESEYAELVLAAGNQYLRKQNRRQVIQKMKARLEDGFWPFCTPPGLKNIPHPLYKKILNGLVQPYANIYKMLINRYGNNELNTFYECRDFVNRQYSLHGINKKISLNGITNILKNPLYAGWIKYEPWNIPLKKAKHDGFITKELFDIVQLKLLGKAKPRLRKDYSLDFPLRSFVLCDVCDKPLTAAWTKGKLQKHPYYWCKNTSCKMVWKTIRRDRIHSEFERVLKSRKPKQVFFDIAKDVFTDIIASFKEENFLLKNENCKKISDIESKIHNLTNRISNIYNNDLAVLYEKEIDKLLNEKKFLKRKQKA